MSNRIQALTMFVIGLGLIGLGIYLIRYPPEGAPWYTGLLPLLVGIALISPAHATFIVESIIRPFMQSFQAAKTSSNEANRDSAEDDKKPEMPSFVKPPENTLDPQETVVGENKPPPAPDAWFKDLRPVLHQVPLYGTPTYYLDRNLYVIDWNIAFELIFAEILGSIHQQHVNELIKRLQNRDQVARHAHEFTVDVHRGILPLVDTEPLRYRSSDYGELAFLKVATQLHDEAGQLRGWSVALMIREIDWAKFEKDLKRNVRLDKLWSVYSASYDRVLLEYDGYHKLIQDVIAVVPVGCLNVLDLGAGTGNVTAALLKAGHNVTAVENNLGMLNRLRVKEFNGRSPTVVKSSIERLHALGEEAFDAAVLVNVLYAVEDPLACLQDVNRLLKSAGALGFSTTHYETNLDLLLNDIKEKLKKKNRFKALAMDYQRLYEVNKDIERTIARRHTYEEYCQWVEEAGFEITRAEKFTYQDAVMLLHARKRKG